MRNRRRFFIFPCHRCCGCRKLCLLLTMTANILHLNSSYIFSLMTLKSKTNRALKLHQNIHFSSRTQKCVHCSLGIFIVCRPTPALAHLRSFLLRQMWPVLLLAALATLCWADCPLGHYGDSCQFACLRIFHLFIFLQNLISINHPHTIADECSTHCETGHCVASHTCHRCKPGWYGQDCGYAYLCGLQCEPNKCTGHNQCAACNAGYHGANCEFGCAFIYHHHHRNKYACQTPARPRASTAPVRARTSAPSASQAITATTARINVWQRLSTIHTQSHPSQTSAATTASLAHAHPTAFASGARRATPVSGAQPSRSAASTATRARARAPPHARHAFPDTAAKTARSRVCRASYCFVKSP